MKNITYLLLCCLLFICSSLHAQQTDIKGIVSDSSGEPLPGVSISIKGTTFGTITNMDGQFTIRAKKGNTLIFSFIGYQTVEQKATDTPMKVTLQESSVQVDEVVVTALGIKKEKKALAYSVTEVKSEELNRVKVSNIANSLVGKVAGVNVVKPASGVMGSSRITIRGNGSLNGSNQPLYVIDGVPMNNGNYGQAGEWGGFDAGDGISRPYSPTARNNFKDFYDNAWSVTNNIAVSGGNEKIQFRVGAGDQRFHDMQPNSKLERNNITLNLTSRMNEHFSLKANIMYVRERAKNRPNLGDITSNANASLWQLAPNYGLSDMKITNDDGTEYEVNAQGYVINPLFVVYKNSQKDAKDRIIGSVEVQYNFTPNWYLRGRAGGDMINRRAENVTPWGTARGAVKEGNISNSAEYHGEFNTEAIAGYTNSFKDGLVSVDAFIGWNTMASWSDATSSYGDQFVVPGFNTINNTKTKSGGHSTSESYINSLFGQAEMSYKSMIYLTLTGRNDWFSALSYKGKTSPNHIFYPSVGLGFILSEAIQMPSWFPYLKLRGSWAQSGGAVGAYQLGLTYSYADAYRKYPVGSIDNGTIPNLNLKPLTSISYEGGFEARFFNNRFGIDFTYYVRNTKDDIVNAGISTASGYGNVKINAGKVNNHGIELLLTGTPILSSHFRWDTSFNFAYNKSEIKRITDDVTEFELAKSRTGHDSDNCGPAWIYQQVGQPYGIIRGVTFKRNDKGEIMYENGLPMKGEIEKLGESVHPYTLGFSNSFECHGFTLSFLLDGKFGGKMYSQTNAHMIMFGRHADTLPGREEGIIAQGVKEDGVTPNDVKVTAMKYYMALSGITENCIYDASFIKLRELSFGYNFPTKWIRKIGLSALSFSVVGRNLWNIYDKVPLVDPESSFNIDNGQGFESYGLPASRSIGFNLNVKF